jgi:hypothetical protein
MEYSSKTGALSGGNLEASVFGRGKVGADNISAPTSVGLGWAWGLTFSPTGGLNLEERAKSSILGPSRQAAIDKVQIKFG